MNRPRQTRSLTRLRRRAALLVCAAWVLGFELGPVVHLGFHEVLEHHHHGAETEHHDNGGDEDAPDHGVNAIEHHGVAVLDPPPAIVDPTPPRIAACFEHEAPRPHVSSEAPTTVRARGPPALA